MHPPFYVVDHRIDPEFSYPLEERRIIRRNRPEALRLTLPGPGAPLITTQAVASSLPLKTAYTAEPATTPLGARRLRSLFIFWRPA